MILNPIDIRIGVYVRLPCVPSIPNCANTFDGSKSIYPVHGLDVRWNDTDLSFYGRH